jgi:hypothetical protein
MKGIRGLLEKDFRLFFRQGSNLFLMLAFMALFFILTGKTGATFIAMYIPSVMAVYSGNTISYDENEHGYTYLFSEFSYTFNRFANESDAKWVVISSLSFCRITGIQP